MSFYTCSYHRAIIKLNICRLVFTVALFPLKTEGVFQIVIWRNQGE